MKSSAEICVKDDKAEIRFKWLNFDGDDCFNDFRIIITTDTDSQYFEFGGSAVYGLRKLARFFQDQSQKSAGLGFRYPDIRTCDLYRFGNSYRLVVRFEGSGLCQQFQSHDPMVDIDDDFLKEY